MEQQTIGCHHFHWGDSRQLLTLSVFICQDI